MSEARRYIVCVDDEQAVLNQLSAQITRGFGDTHIVECTESAEEALGLMEEIFTAGDEVELVICDQVMPGMKGGHFLHLVRARWPDVMKILLTGQAGLESAIYAINEAGLHRYIEKPWEAEDLNVTIRNLLTQHALKKDVVLSRNRLERRSRELHSLHELGLSLGAAVRLESILDSVASAARSLSGAVSAAVVAQVGSREACWGGSRPGSPEDRAALEAALARGRASAGGTLPEKTPPGWQPLEVGRGDTLFGWILMQDAPPPTQDAKDLLAILANQAAGSLANVQHLAERLESERLSTIGRMISTIVHDFRNPMTAVKGYSAMIEEFDLDRDKLRECARLIIEESDRMSLMIDEILEFTQGGRSRLKLTTVTVEELVAKVRRLMALEFKARGVAFRSELAYPGPLTVDVDRLKRAILNIASNALDAMGEGGVFTFASRLGEGGAVEILLTDTGGGIPEEIRGRIFEPFFTHGKPRGIGLGMSITRRIVEEHGGQVSVDCRPGQGTCFILRLPLSPPMG